MRDWPNFRAGTYFIQFLKLPRYVAAAPIHASLKPFIVKRFWLKRQNTAFLPVSCSRVQFKSSKKLYGKAKRTADAVNREYTELCWVYHSNSRPVVMNARASNWTSNHIASYQAKRIRLKQCISDMRNLRSRNKLIFATVSVHLFLNCMTGRSCALVTSIRFTEQVTVKKFVVLYFRC
jgi:hypothetical protein